MSIKCILASALLVSGLAMAAPAAAQQEVKIGAVLPTMADQQQMLERLQEFQSQSVAQMQRYLKAITDVQDRIDRD